MNQVINSFLISLNKVGTAFCGHAASVFVQSALLVILLFAVDLLLRRRVRAIFRYCLWMLVLIKLVLPPMLSVPTGIGYWVGDRLPVGLAASNEAFDVVGGEGASSPAETPGVRPYEAIAEKNPVRGLETSALTRLRWQAVLFILWLAGVLAFLAVLVQRIRFVRALMAASHPAEKELYEVLEQCRLQIRVRRAIRLRTSDTIPGPAVCGSFKPTILLPTSLAERLSPEGLRATLIHELAHIKRGDLWVNSVQTLLQIVYFYNPFVWFANSVIRKVCEEAVDETVLVTLGGQAASYSNTLIDIGETVFWKADLGLRLIGVAESKKALQWRIRHMLNRPIPKSSKLGVLGIAVLLAIAAVLLPMAKAQKPANNGEPAVATASEKPAGAQTASATEEEKKSYDSLCEAAEAGDLAEVRRLIAEGSDVDEKSGRFGGKALHGAARGGHKEIAALLIEEGADLHARDVVGRTPLHCACQQGHREVAELLIDSGADIELKDNLRSKPLDYALRQGHKQIVELLRPMIDLSSIHVAAKLGDLTIVKAFLEKGTDIESKDEDGKTALHIATDYKHKDVVEFLIDQGADVNAADGDKYKHTPLFYAVWNSDTDLARLLISRGADVNATYEGGWTPLHEAVWAEDLDVAKILVENGAKFDAKASNGATPLHEAVNGGCDEIIKLFVSKGIGSSSIHMAAFMGDVSRVRGFIDKGTDVDAKDEAGWTALFWAVCMGHEEVAEFLIDNNADAKASDGPGRNLLIKPVRGNALKLVELLISGGADVNSRNKSDRPLHAAIRLGNKKLVELLVDGGADVNQKATLFAVTPLHVAAEKGHYDIVKLLIAKGADLTVSDRRGRSALDLAEKEGHMKIVELLKKHGAKE